MPTFDLAPPVRTIADELIPLYHKHLLEHRVRMEYVFSDQANETNGKAKWGKSEKWTSLKAFLAGDADDDQHFEPLTFVCCLCRKWCIEEERKILDVHKHRYAYCPGCLTIVQSKDVTTNRVISDLSKKAEEAHVRELNGPPVNPGFFVITIYSTYWARMGDAAKRALVDHELCHCDCSLDRYGDVKLSIQPHDLEEFKDVVIRHGTQWRGDLREFDRAIKDRDKQMTLELAGTDATPEHAELRKVLTGMKEAG